MQHLQRWIYRGLCGGLVISLMTLASRPSYAKDNWYATDAQWAAGEGFCYSYDEWSNNTPYMAGKGAPGDTSTPRPVPDLDCWLTRAFPDIAAHVIWQRPDLTATPPSYPDWTPAEKADLSAAFARAWSWYENGFRCNAQNQSDCDQFPFGSWDGSVPPQNQVANNPNNEHGHTVLSPTDAWHYYVDSVGQTLAAQLGHWFFWDLRSGGFRGDFISPGDLNYLLDSREMFYYADWGVDPPNHTDWLGYSMAQSDGSIPGQSDSPIIHGNVTPTAPRYQLDFLRRSGIIKDGDVASTVYAAFDWGRDNLVHFDRGGLSDTEAEIEIWHYDGQPPVSFMLNGTQSTTAFDTQVGNTGVLHWTAGCHGTSGFYKSLLRSANIPVQVLNVRSAHSQIYLPISPLYAFLSHSDDIYGSDFRDTTHMNFSTPPPTTPVHSTQYLFLTYANSYPYFFPPEDPVQQAADVGAGKAYYVMSLHANGFAPTNYMMSLYCGDLANYLTHSASSVYAYFVSFGLTVRGITLSGLESSGLWTALETKRLATPGGCSNASFQPIAYVPPGNKAPLVNAGPDQTIPANSAAVLVGTVSDDGLPDPPAMVITTWSMVSGPGIVTFNNASYLTTAVTFSKAGSYTLRLTANDGALSASDDVVITVVNPPTNQAPVVNAGPDQTITLPAAASLSGTVTDDGLPTGTVTTTWSMVSGPGTVTFSNASSTATNWKLSEFAVTAATTATFSVAGTYTLRLTASDSALSAKDDIVVTVNAPPPPPGPCSGLCSNPMEITALPALRIVGTYPFCLETTTNMQAFACADFVSPRLVKINGSVVPCTVAARQFTSLPAKINGGYCIQVQSGGDASAWISPR